MYIQEKCGDYMEKQHNMKNNTSVQKRTILFSAILLSLLIFFTSTVSACNYAYVPNLNFTMEGSTPHGSSVQGSSGLTGAIMPNGTVSVIDTATNKVLTNVTVGKYPVGVAISSDGTTVYVTNSYSNTLSVINTATNTVKATVNVGEEPVGVAVSGNYVYVANCEDDTVSVIDKATNTVISTLNVGDDPEGIVSTANYIYVTNCDDDTVSVINTAYKYCCNYSECRR